MGVRVAGGGSRRRHNIRSGDLRRAATARAETGVRDDALEDWRTRGIALRSRGSLRRVDRFHSSGRERQVRRRERE